MHGEVGTSPKTNDDIEEDENVEKPKEDIGVERKKPVKRFEYESGATYSRRKSPI